MLHKIGKCYTSSMIARTIIYYKSKLWNLQGHYKTLNYARPTTLTLLMSAKFYYLPTKSELSWSPSDHPVLFVIGI